MILEKEISLRSLNYTFLNLKTCKEEKVKSSKKNKNNKSVAEKKIILNRKKNFFAMESNYKIDRKICY